MDKKNLLIGIVFIAAAVGLLFKNASDSQKAAEMQREKARAAAAASPEQSSSPSVSPNLGEQVTAEKESRVQTGPSEGTQELHSRMLPVEKETVKSLSNDYIEVHFSSRGGAIREVLMPKHRATRNDDESYIFNQDAIIPALAYFNTQDQGKSWTPYLADFREVSRGKGPHGGQEVVFEAALPSGLLLRRSYEIAETPHQDSSEKSTPTWEPYQILHRTEFVNPTDQTLYADRFALGLGTAEPVNSDPRGDFLNFGSYDGSSANFIKTSQFDGGGFMSVFGAGRPAVSSISSKGNVVWGSIKNQYFTSVLTPDQPAVGYFTNPIKLPASEFFPEGARAITGILEFDSIPVAAGETASFSSGFYVGPKEYSRLNRLDHKQELIMQFGFFGGISKLLLTLMNWVYSLIPNYGIAIILVTILIKGMLWPLTAKAANSSKKMAQIQAPLKEIKEKYKDNQQKLQAETLKLFRANKVNPLAGCLPILVQIPIFISLYWMLRSATELRHAEFFWWIQDLSQPDTIGYISGFPINILPLFMGVSMFFQMRMTSISIDSTQAKLFKFMPFIFLIFCYNFSSGLVLYWTVQNLITILQQYLTNKRKDPEGTQVVLTHSTKKKSKKKK